MFIKEKIEVRITHLMEHGEARMVFTLIRGWGISHLAPIIFAAVPLLHLDLIRVFLQLLDVLERGFEGGRNGGGEPLGGRVHWRPLLGRGNGRPDLYHLILVLLLVKVSCDLFRLLGLYVGASAHRAARGVEEGCEVSGLCLTTSPALVSVMKVRLSRMVQTGLIVIVFHPELLPASSVVTQQFGHINL